MQIRESIVAYILLNDITLYIFPYILYVIYLFVYILVALVLNNANRNEIDYLRRLRLPTRLGGNASAQKDTTGFPWSATRPVFCESILFQWWPWTRGCVIREVMSKKVEYGIVPTLDRRSPVWHRQGSWDRERKKERKKGVIDSRLTWPSVISNANCTLANCSFSALPLYQTKQSTLIRCFCPPFFVIYIEIRK